VKGLAEPKRGRAGNSRRIDDEQRAKAPPSDAVCQSAPALDNNFHEPYIRAGEAEKGTVL
jgi:hypothetical protein